MKRFLIKFIFFLLLLFNIDIACGLFSHYLMSHAKGGSTEKNYYIAERLKSDIIILGSSRATHHYVPQIIEDSTSLTCYNCGEEGNGSILAYARFKMITDRFHPKIVIYEITPEYDYFKDDDYSKYLRYLKPYYSNIHVKYIFGMFTDKIENFKLISNMYRNNSLFVTNIVDNLIKRPNEKGYASLYGKIKKNIGIERVALDVDVKKNNMFEAIISECVEKKIHLLLVISPRYKTVKDRDYYKHAMKTAKSKGLRIYDFREAKGIYDDPGLFNDLLHMNNRGACIYTERYICDLIKREIGMHRNPKQF